MLFRPLGMPPYVYLLSPPLLSGLSSLPRRISIKTTGGVTQAQEYDPQECREVGGCMPQQRPGKGSDKLAILLFERANPRLLC
jgi:hypothetical protein